MVNKRGKFIFGCFLLSLVLVVLSLQFISANSFVNNVIFTYNTTANYDEGGFLFINWTANGSAAGNYTVYLWMDNRFVNSTANVNTSATGYFWAANTTEANYTFTIESITAANYSRTNATNISIYINSAKPTFTTVPSNATIYYGNDSLSVVFLGADSVSFSNSSVNDTTNFTLTSYSNGTGVLKNASSLVVGRYSVNVTIIDSTNNINWTSYIITVNKAPYCIVLFNATSPVTYPEYFKAYTNCSTGVTLQRNGSTIANNSDINAGADAYNISFNAPAENFTTSYNSSEFRVIKSSENCRVLFDTTSPGTHGTNFTVWGNCSTGFSLYRNGTSVANNSLQYLDVGTYNFSLLRTDASNFSIYYNETVFAVAAATATTVTTNAGGSGGTSSTWTNTYVQDNVEFSEKNQITQDMSAKSRVRIKLSGQTHYVGVVSLTSTTAALTVSSTPQQKTMSIGEEWKVEVTGDNYYDILVKLNNIVSNKADITLNYIHDLIETASTPEEEQDTGATTDENAFPETTKNKISNVYYYIGGGILLVLIVLLVIWFLIFKPKKKSSHRFYKI